MTGRQDKALKQNKIKKLDESGYLEDPQKWSKEVSEYIAEKESISLTEDHWKVIEAVRKYYYKYGCDEMHLMACKDAGLEEGCIKRLFGGSIRQFEKIAGNDLGNTLRGYNF